MTMHKAIELGNKIELVTALITGQEQRKYYSMIQEVTPDEDIVIQAPISEGVINPLELNQRYGMSVYSEAGLFRSEVEVVKRFKEGNLYLIQLSLLSNLQKFQRRQYYRMDCILNFQYKDDDDTKWDEGTILDISGGGIRFISKKQLIPDKGIINHIRLMLREEAEDFYIPGQIIDSIATGTGQKLFENRVVFDEVEASTRESIIKFIFEEERRRRQSGRRM